MYSALLFFHFIGIALGVGTGFAALRLGGAVKSLPAAERFPFFERVSVIGKNGSMGLGLLILTGLGMMSLRGFAATFAWGGGALHAKLGLVVLLAGTVGYQQVVTKRVKKEGGGPSMALLPKLGLVILFLSLSVTAAAVAAFQ
jgi:hypothetical protein